jgi:HK97 family phage prohead protease
MRQHKTFEFELKKADAESGEFSGLASTYGNVDAHGDVVMPGAFTKTIQENAGRVVLLANHEPSMSIGIASIFDSPKGLRVEGRLLLELPSAMDMYVRMKHGLVSSMSIGYETRGEKFVNGVRQLTELKLWEISLVTFPANAQAVVESVKDGDVARLLRRLASDVRATSNAIKTRSN